jgi:hypothetical protein
MHVSDPQVVNVFAKIPTDSGQMYLYIHVPTVYIYIHKLSMYMYAHVKILKWILKILVVNTTTAKFVRFSTHTGSAFVLSLCSKPTLLYLLLCMMIRMDYTNLQSPYRIYQLLYRDRIYHLLTESLSLQSQLCSEGRAACFTCDIWVERYERLHI